ncbi:MAG: MotA/TolQ/ExbB proton channel family protein [Nocardioides sp.]|uniref:MotA/TolQ/ExbB proton channel family protein n=1 Tax=Nocardioides sp. TaxID=35761 RepID=UPI0039E21873
MSEDVYRVIYQVAEVLEVPVVLLALAALALVLVEAGAFVVEVARRRRRRFPALVAAADTARDVVVDDREAARAALAPVAWSQPMAQVLGGFAEEAGTPGDEPRMAKRLADFDLAAQRRLGRTRLLVRVGPALGLMGTLIPLSPALDGLARGDVETLTSNLQTAFSITVLGLLVGAVAFALSLWRDRIYAQDYSDLEYVAAVLTSPDAS